MKTAIIALILFVTAGAVSHSIALTNFPGYVMSQVFERFEARGLPEHKFILSEQITPQTQSIVRPAPDLAYSICRFDVSDGPVRISGAKWDGYASLSLFDADTNNVFVSSLDTASAEPASVIVAEAGQAALLSGTATPIVELEKTRGLALIRRLAPTTELYAEVQGLGEGDLCEKM